MDNLKIRAWDKKEKRMCSVVAIWFSLDSIILESGIFVYERKLDEVELMQSTGLNGEDGVEIYEGDIVIYDRNISDTVDRFPYVVIYNEGNFVLEYGLIQHNLFNNTEYVTVIGNIYENPELLEDN